MALVITAKRMFRLGMAMAAAGLMVAVVQSARAEAEGRPNRIAMVSPADGATVESFLTAVLQWAYPLNRDLAPWWDVSIEVSRQADLSQPFVKCDLKDETTEHRLAVLPETTYYWRVTPFQVADGKRVELADSAARGRFTTGRPLNRIGAPDVERYRNPRRGAHWVGMPPVPFAQEEALSPWFEVKAYRKSPPPKLAAIRDRFPVPVWDGHSDALDAYWYCWETILRVWTYAPFTDHHQAVSNLIGYPNWGAWGSTMIFDTCFMLHYARYGDQAYSFVTGLDNVYARQHENGYICRESDKDNHEVSSGYPVNPPLLAWAEWEYYQVTADKARLGAVFLPLVKHYEWWMTYQRRENGLYWTNGLQEADDSPRNALMHSAVSATSYQGLVAQCLARMAAELGRTDMRKFFEAQNDELKGLVNRFFWDDKHQIYNDLDKNGRPITELQPGSFCKHVHMFWPLMAGFATPERAAGMVKELKNPASFNRASGVPSLSADSAGYNQENGQYWRGAVWPPTQCMVQEGLKLTGYEDDLQELAAKYYRACVSDYQNQKTLRENMAPDKAVSCGAPDFVGWAGIGPIANLIEYILGFELNAPAKTITWSVRQGERHGLTNLRFNGFRVDLVAEAASATEPRSITIDSGGEFTLRVVVNRKATEIRVARGVTRHRIGS